MRDLAGKVAFVTGGASGIGLAMVRSFAGAGMKVVVADIEQIALDAVADEFRDSNTDIHTVRVDVTDRDSFAAAANEAEEVFEKIHLLCNNAGVVVFAGLADLDYRDWDWVTSVNTNGVVNGIKEILPRIQAHGEGGHVVNTASIAGVTSMPNLGIYNASKWAVVALSETLRQELEGSEIGVSVLCPGGVSTNIARAERNRPGGPKDGRVERRATPRVDVSDVAVALDAAAVGDMVLEAVQSNDLYVFTHPDAETMSDRRFSAMKEAFARWRKYREERGI
jgi:NADP-dependent 3-hydroxy acid dehydrogenase YdfG